MRSALQDAGLAQGVHALAGTTDRVVTLIDGSGRSTAPTWDALYRQGRAVAGGLHALGVRPGDRVALMFDTSEALIASLLGCWISGAAPTPIYPPVRMGRLTEWTDRTARMLDLAETRLLLTSGLALPWVGEVVARAQLPLGARVPSQLPARDAPDREIDPEGLGLVQFSSGTTGAPKAVKLSQRALVAQVRCIAAPLLRAWPEYIDTGVGCGWLPLYHDMGLIGLFLTPMLLRRPVVLMSPQRFLARPGEWLQAISDHRANVSVAPNFAYGLCAERVTDEAIAGLDLSTWRVALNGAEPISPDTLRRFQERFAPAGFRPEALTPVYGLSEAALAVSFSSIARPWRAQRFERSALSADTVRPTDAPDGMEVVSCGTALPECAFEVRVGGKPVEERVGRLHIRSPSLMTGYLGDPDETARVLVDGWLDTGDRAFVHGGELYLLGRYRDVLILRGENHDPTPLERAIDGLPGARVGCAAAVSFRPEGHDTEILALFVEHALDADEAAREALPALCAAKVAADTGLQPDLVEVLAPGTLPRTSSGKIRRSEATTRFVEGRLTPPEVVTRRYLAARAVASGVGWVRRWLG